MPEEVLGQVREASTALISGRVLIALCTDTQAGGQARQVWAQPRDLPYPAGHSPLERWFVLALLEG